MSSITWSDNHLIQQVREREEELGYIDLEPNSGKYVLWLKDTFGVANTPGAYIRADEYPSMAVARMEAPCAPSVLNWHLIWMRSVVEGSRDRPRAHRDRWLIDKIKKLSETIDMIAAISKFFLKLAAIFKLCLKFW